MSVIICDHCDKPVDLDWHYPDCPCGASMDFQLDPKMSKLPGFDPATDVGKADLDWYLANGFKIIAETANYERDGAVLHHSAGLVVLLRPFDDEAYPYAESKRESVIEGFWESVYERDCDWID